MDSALFLRRLALVELVVVESDQINAATRRALRILWDRAYGDRFSEDDADHAYGGVHVLARDDDLLIGHASAVPRRLRFGDEPWRTVGYVEAVATDPDRQGEGVGRRTMECLQEEISSRWPAALLSTGRATGFYELLGWERWRGLSYTQTTTGAVPDGEHGGLMVLRLDRSVVPDLSVGVTCEDRPGDAW
jgi:aminoglycoside 2'-N-acetyltransferase I